LSERLQAWNGEREALARDLRTVAALIEGASVTASGPAAKRGRPAGTGRKKGGMSAAGRARIAAAQKARWAKIHAAQGKKKKGNDHGNG
jgi:hypothetical protein